MCTTRGATGILRRGVGRSPLDWQTSLFPPIAAGPYQWRSCVRRRRAASVPPAGCVQYRKARVAGEVHRGAPHRPCRSCRSRPVRDGRAKRRRAVVPPKPSLDTLPSSAAYRQRARRAAPRGLTRSAGRCMRPSTAADGGQTRPRCLCGEAWQKLGVSKRGMLEWRVSIHVRCWAANVHNQLWTSNEANRHVFWQ